MKKVRKGTAHTVETDDYCVKCRIHAKWHQSKKLMCYWCHKGIDQSLKSIDNVQKPKSAKPFKKGKSNEQSIAN